MFNATKIPPFLVELNKKMVPIPFPESILDPTCWAIINEDRNTCCLVAREHELFKLSQGYSVCSVQSVSIEKEFKSIIAMSVSYNHRFLALYTNNGIVWMGTSNLQTKYCEFKTNQSEKPKQIEWLVGWTIKISLFRELCFECNEFHFE